MSTAPNPPPGIFERWTPLFWCHVPWLALAAWWIHASGAPLRRDEWAVLFFVLLCPLFPFWALLWLVGWPLKAALGRDADAARQTASALHAERRRRSRIILLCVTAATLFFEFGVAMTSMLVDERWMGVDLFGPYPSPCYMPLNMVILLAAGVWCVVAIMVPGPPGLAGRWFAGALQITPAFWLLFIVDPVILAGLERWPAAAMYGEGIAAALTACLVFGKDDATARRRGRTGMVCMIILPFLFWAVDRARWTADPGAACLPGVKVILPEGYAGIGEAYWGNDRRWLVLHVSEKRTPYHYGNIWVVERATGNILYRLAANSVRVTRLFDSPWRIVGLSNSSGRLNPPALFWRHDLATGKRDEIPLADQYRWADRFLAPDDKTAAWLEIRSAQEAILRRVDVGTWRELEAKPVPLETDWKSGRGYNEPVWAPDGALVVTAEHVPPGANLDNRSSGPVFPTQWRLAPDGREEVHVSPIPAYRWYSLADPARLLLVHLNRLNTQEWMFRDEGTQAIVDMGTGRVFPLPDRFTGDDCPVVQRRGVPWLYGNETDADGRAWVAAYDWNTGERVFRVRTAREGWWVTWVSEDGKKGLLRDTTAESGFARSLDMTTGEERPCRGVPGERTVYSLAPRPCGRDMVPDDGVGKDDAMIIRVQPPR